MAEHEDMATAQRPAPGRLLKLDVRASTAIVRAGKRVAVQMERTMRESGTSLRANDFDALVFLAGEGPMRPVALLRHVGLTESPATMHAILKRLEQAGYAERSADPDDARGVMYAATASGQAEIERLFPLVEHQLGNRFFGHFSDEELEEIVALADRVI